MELAEKYTQKLNIWSKSEMPFYKDIELYCLSKEELAKAKLAFQQW